MILFRLTPTARYFPLRFHCVKMMNTLSESTNTFIPVLPYLLEVGCFIILLTHHSVMGVVAITWRLSINLLLFILWYVNRFSLSEINLIERGQKVMPCQITAIIIYCVRHRPLCPFNYSEKFLSEVFQHICCTSCCF